MSQPQNPNIDPLLARIDKNPTGADLIQVVNTLGGQGIVWRLNQFQSPLYVGFSDPTFIPGELPYNVYLNLSTGAIWYLSASYVWTLVPSGGGAGGSTVETLSTVAGTITGTFDGSNVTFTLETAPDSPDDLMLYLNGIYQIQGTDYTLSGSVVTMTVPPDPNGQIVAVINISTESLVQTLSSVGGTITGSINGSNTVFNTVITPSATTNTLLFLNGIYQIQGVDYTMSSSTITMTVAPSTGDELVAVLSTSSSGGGGGSALGASFTTTGTSSTTVIILGTTPTSQYTYGATNASAALDIASGNVYVGAKGTGTVVINHGLTVGMTFDIIAN